ncbi:hypothetical protein COCNU_14G008150 [Cocos nucifera]|uniref:Uncharacterized protein n=1 Tax=Cocos nucifera TaxID=13894 RepID=A0A8K0IVB6_COCNU|nr:hypothetical protein COCNU_14G008150 [Cocos nucifera]
MDFSRSGRTVNVDVHVLMYKIKNQAENSHVSKYKMVLKTFPVSLRKQKWSNMEKEKLAKGIKQQYQEMLILNSMNFERYMRMLSDIDSNLISALSSSDLDITPEKIRSFIPLVNWDQLASMYLTGRSGAQCEARSSGLLDKLSIDKSQIQLVMPQPEVASLGCGEPLLYLNGKVKCIHHPDICGIQESRWRKSLNPDRRKVGRWSVDEDKRLKVAVMLFGAKNWKKIAQFAPGRTQVQCRERWLNCLDPSLNLKAWTEEEDAKLLAAIAEHGYCWSKVATCVPPRTDSQCRRRWKVLLPHEVPLLQAARKMKRTVLISNFVDRESERPAIGPNDFTPLVNLSETENNDSTRPGKKRSSDNQPKKSRVKSRRSFKENSIADGVINSSTNAVPADSAIVCSINSDTADGGSSKRSRKKKSSDDQPNNSMVKSRGYCKENIMADGMVGSSTETAPADLSLVPSASSNAAENGSIEGTGKRTSSNNQLNQSRGKSRGFIKLNLETDAVVNSPGDRVPAGLSAVPNVNFCTAECGGNKSSAQRTLRSHEENKTTVDMVINTYAETIAGDASFIPVINSNNAKSGNIKSMRKKTLSKNSRTSYPCPRARRERSLEELPLTDSIIKGNIISKELVLPRVEQTLMEFPNRTQQNKFIVKKILQLEMQNAGDAFENNGIDKMTIKKWLETLVGLLLMETSPRNPANQGKAFLVMDKK